MLEQRDIDAWVSDAKVRLAKHKFHNDLTLVQAQGWAVEEQDDGVVVSCNVVLAYSANISLERIEDAKLTENVPGIGLPDGHVWARFIVVHEFDFREDKWHPIRSHGAGYWASI